MNFLNEIDRYSSELKAVIDSVDKSQIVRFVDLLLKHYENESHIFTFGNGGSGLTASHFVCDFNKGVSLDLDKKFKFTCLNDNVGSMLAYSNDISYDEVFCLQLKNFLNPGDLVIGISGSGNSKNVIKAIEHARQIGADTFSLCGFDGGRLKDIDQNNCIHVPLNDMQIVEDYHMVVLHMTMRVLYKKLNGNG